MTTYLVKFMPILVVTNIKFEIKSALGYSFGFFIYLLKYSVDHTVIIYSYKQKKRICSLKMVRHLNRKNGGQ